MSSPSKSHPADTYVLGRDAYASTRLNCQHYFLKEMHGWLLHNSIPLDKKDIAIADVATGTGIWLLDIDRQLNNTSARLDGFDISLDQCPPAAWRPDNVHFHQWNVFEEPDPRFCEKYDVVHVRLLVAIINQTGNDPRPVLKNLLKLLKPGGYLQWAEPSFEDRVLMKSDPDLPVEDYLRMSREILDTQVHTLGTGWVKELGGHFEAEGLENVVSVQGNIGKTWVHPFSTCMQTVYQELLGGMGAERRERLQPIVEKGLAAAQKGVCWDTPRIFTVGQKAER